MVPTASSVLAGASPAPPTTSQGKPSSAGDLQAVGMALHSIFAVSLPVPCGRSEDIRSYYVGTFWGVKVMFTTFTLSHILSLCYWKIVCVWLSVVLELAQSQQRACPCGILVRVRFSS